MYKLFLNNNGVRTMIDITENEQDIVDTIGEYIKENKEAKFIIMYSQQYGDYIYAIINGQKGYIDYLQNYKEKLIINNNLKK